MDRSPEGRAAHFFQLGLYPEALQAYTLYLSSLPVNCKPEQRITGLFNRSACHLKLKQFHKVVEDCNLILQIDNKHEKALGRKVKAMCSLGQFSEAQSLAYQWIHRDPTNHQARKELERLNVIVKALSEQDNEEDLEMGSSVKISPQHRHKSPLAANSAISNNGWTVGSPLTSARSLDKDINGLNKLWGGFDDSLSHSSSLGEDSNGSWRLDNSDHFTETTEKNSWGVAINTDWGEEYSETRTGSVVRVGSSMDSSGNSRVGAVEASSECIRSEIMPSTSSENTHLVWSTNILSGPASSPQSLHGLLKKQTISDRLRVQGRQTNDIEAFNENKALTSTVHKGDKSNMYVMSGNSTFASEMRHFEGGSHLGSETDKLGNEADKTTESIMSPLWKDPPEKQYSSLWSDPDPFNCRQKGQSPPWEFSDKKKSRFSFANEDRLNFETFCVADILDEKAVGEDTVIGELKPAGGGFLPVTVVDTFSKSLVSPSTQTDLFCAGRGSLQNGSPAAMSSTDKLFLQHMQRNTGSQKSNTSAPELGKIQGNASITYNTAGCPYPQKAAGVLEEEMTMGGENKDGQAKGRSAIQQVKPVVPQAFIPHVVQAQMIVGVSKHDTSLIPGNRRQSTSSSSDDTHKTPERDPSSTLHDSNAYEAVSPKQLSVSSTQECLKEKMDETKQVQKMDETKQVQKMDETKQVHEDTGSKETHNAESNTAEAGTVSSIEDSPPRVWKWRPPPRGLTSQEYSKCNRFSVFGVCSFGNNCSQAHSEEELCEWRERFEERKKELIRQKEEAQDSSSYIEKLLEKLMKALNQETVMTENVEYANLHSNYKLSIHTPSKKYSHIWLFTVTSKLFLKKIVLLDDNHRRHFHISAITCGSKKSKKSQRIIKLSDNCQDWDNSEYKPGKTAVDKVYRIKVSFSTEIFGTFRQSLVFDFGLEPLLMKELCVDSCPVTDLDQLTEDLILNQSGRWDINNISVIEFSPKVFTPDDEEQLLLETYPVPTADKVASLSESQSLLEAAATRENYREWMHNLLYIEEIAQFSSIAKFNVTTDLQLTHSFMLMPNTVTTAKYAQNGELFARMAFTSVLSEDTAQGRLILQNVYTVYLAKSPGDEEDQHPDKVYEALIEEKGKNFVFLRLSARCVQDLNLKADHTLRAQVQFQLNRMPVCEMHLAVDVLPNVDTVFPPSQSFTRPPWKQDQLKDATFQEKKLNEKQREALAAITLTSSERVSPILLVGPYGTGKTYTLAQAAMEIIKQDATRVLICTHSNSAADLYIKDYFHHYVVDGHPEALPLRIYYRHRWVQTVNAVVLQYSLTRVDPVRGTVFVNPTKEDVEKRRIIVATFSTARQLYQLDLPEGFFTHILLDEAAQALECETIMPLVLACERTRVVLAGDHMQLSPEVHSEFARDRSFQVSIVERLYHYYPQTFVCKIMLCENYRSHKAIVDLTSELFYNSHLRSCGNQSVHDKFYPLTFFTARGEDTQHQNSTGFFNNAEVNEVVDRVVEVYKSWPDSWGPLDESSIGVVSPYTDQVVRIRSELRKKKLHSICVERVLNVQGKQFRVIFLSTVRTRHTCDADSAVEEYMDYGFLSNVKLLNTAITRAQSLVAVVGDPVALCSIGKCRKLWERFLELSNSKQCLHGMAWSYLRAQLDGVELKKTYLLNPLAPEFVPNRLRHGQYTAPEPIAYGKYGYAFAPSNAGPAVTPMGGAQNVPWIRGYQRPPQHNLPQQDVPVPLMNYGALQYLSMLQGGNSMDPQSLPLFLAALQQPGIRPEHIPLNVQRPRPGQQPQPQATSPEASSSSTKTNFKPEEAKTDKATKQDQPPGEVAGNQANLLTSQVKGQTLHPVPPGAPPPIPPQHPLQHQFPFQQQQAFNQQVFNQALRAAEAVRHLNPFLFPMAARYPNIPAFHGGQLVNPMPPFLPPHLIGQKGAASFGGFPPHPNLAGGTMGGPAHPPVPFLQPPNVMSTTGQALRSNLPSSQQPSQQHQPLANPALHLKNRSLQSPNLSVSPGSTRSGSQSPSRLARPQTPKMEFLPKAVNVRSPPQSSNVQDIQHSGHTAAAQQREWGVSGSSRNGSIPVSQNVAALRNPFLHRELYGYIVQTEGQMAADRFVSHQQQHPNSLKEKAVTEGDNHSNRFLNGLQAHESHNSLLPGFYPRGHMDATSLQDSGPPLPSTKQFMAEDLERQWQEESLRGKHVSQAAGVDILKMNRIEYKRWRGLKREDDKIVYNPNFEAISEKFLEPKRQSPFREGPQPYSRQKMLGEAKNASNKSDPVSNSAKQYSCDLSRDSDDSKDQGSLTSPLNVEVLDGILERELGQMHIDSSVDLVNMSPNSREQQRKVPLYMRRVQTTSTTETLSPPRLSYAGALRHANSQEGTPPSAPLTKGPYTPEVNPFFPQTNNEQDKESLLLLRNLNIQESPKNRSLFK